MWCEQFIFLLAVIGPSPSLPLSIFSPDIVLRKPRVMSCRAFDVAIASHIDATDQAGAACLQIEVSGDNLIDGIRPVTAALYEI